ncbi:MAG TPA: bifunctional phosphoserine phosphatase/homoserine phosphotransferase ThrH [Bacteroidales bacterium]|nr:bifunctional phosphoserine phosphatase/homoserine phosphotransferase ThrH [Bacteroidales bacterium]HPT22564.1 bifunctional phosphoserine phosphatase/homoserine phosphotransferase ThrH [Bacteroidales bacterium]
MYIVCSDLEGVYVPEIWINVAKQTGIDELKLTTRDISDYNVLMKRRLGILKEHGLTLQDIQNVIASIKPLPGALEFMDWLRSHLQLIIVSDTFIEFADPLLKQLGRPTLLCHQLTTDSKGNITDYNLRQKDSKKKVTEALQNLNYKVIGIGDSYNDISMLRTAELGILYNPPQNVIEEHKDLNVVKSYDELKKIILQTIYSEK